MNTVTDNSKQAASVAAYFLPKIGDRRKWWHWIIGFALICLLSFIGMAGLMLGSQTILPTNNTSIYFDLLLAFIPIFISVPLIYKFWHKRSVTSLMTSTRKFRWDYMLRAGFF